MLNVRVVCKGSQRREAVLFRRGRLCGRRLHGTPINANTTQDTPLISHGWQIAVRTSKISHGGSTRGYMVVVEAPIFHTLKVVSYEHKERCTPLADHLG